MPVSLGGSLNVVATKERFYGLQMDLLIRLAALFEQLNEMETTFPGT